MVNIRLLLDFHNIDETSTIHRYNIERYEARFSPERLGREVQISRVPQIGEKLILLSDEWLVVDVKHRIYADVWQKENEDDPDADVYVQIFS